MKKIIFIFFAAIGFITVHAQHGNGMQMMRQELKDSVGLTEVQIDSVIAIHQQFQPQMREAMSDTTNKKSAEIKAIHEQETQRLSAILTPAEMVKLEAVNKKMHHGKKPDASSSDSGND